MTGGGHRYAMTLSLNVLRHLGFGLYSNIAAVLSEVVANAWDADAENVRVSIDATDGHVTIEDDGHGMTVEDANQKYLTVGYERRHSQSRTPAPRPAGDGPQGDRQAVAVLDSAHGGGSHRQGRHQARLRDGLR